MSTFLTSKKNVGNTVTRYYVPREIQAWRGASSGFSNICGSQDGTTRWDLASLTRNVCSINNDIISAIDINVDTTIHCQ